MSLLSKFRRDLQFEAGELRLLISDFRFSRPRPVRQGGGVLIVRTDAIGDYMLFRQALRSLRHVPRFAGRKITLCGNAVWRELAESLDADSFDTFIPIERQRFLKNRQYRHELLSSVREEGFSIALQPTYSREYIGDSLIRASAAPTRIGFAGPAQNMSHIARQVFNWSYTELIAAAPGFPFELQRNIEVLNYLQIEKSGMPAFQDVMSPSLEHRISEGIVALKGSPVFFLGASDVSKRWSAHLFAKLVPYVFDKYQVPILLEGGTIAKEGMKSIADLYPERVVPVPETNLLEMVFLVANAPLLISNDSVAAHVGATYGVPTVIISNGQHRGRFHPYPREVAPYVRTVYPEKMRQDTRNYYYRASPYSIADVSPEVVKKAIIELCE